MKLTPETVHLGQKQKIPSPEDEKVGQLAKHPLLYLKN